MTMKERLKAAIKEAGNPSNKELADRVTALLNQAEHKDKKHPDGKVVPAQTIQKIRSKGDRSFYIAHLAQVLDVSAIWLAEGHGPKTEGSQRFARKHVSLLRNYMRLPSELRAPIRMLIEGITTALDPEYQQHYKDRRETAKRKSRQKYKHSKKRDA